uniref:Protein odr-4 homolog n=1 Tax=Ciona savignyi TaxID=51511 RepID=H2Y5A8_CIOSA
MGKTINVDSSLSQYFNTVVKTGKPTVGIIVGKTTKTKDYVVNLIQSPSKDGTFEINETWIASHATNISPMLPSGISIIGIYVVHDAKSVDVQTTRKVVYAIHKNIQRTRSRYGLNIALEDSLHYTTLHVDISNGRTLSCKQYDVLDNSCSAKPADWRYGASPTRWSLLQTQVSLDKQFYVDTMGTMMQQLKTLLSDFCCDITNGLMTMNGEIRNNEEVLDPDPPSGGKGKKSKNSLPTKSGKIFKCQLYLPIKDSDDATEIDASRHKCRVGVCGSITAWAYMPSKTSVQEAIQMLKSDVAQTLHHRYELLKADLEDQNTKLNSTMDILLPKRLQFKKSETDNFVYSDYLSKGESIPDVVDRIRELFNSDIDPRLIDSDFEKFPEVITPEVEIVEELVPEPSVDEVGVGLIDECSSSEDEECSSHDEQVELVKESETPEFVDETKVPNNPVASSTFKGYIAAGAAVIVGFVMSYWSIQE